MATTKELLRLRFAELTASRDAILAQSTPIREARDAITRAAEADLAAQVDPLNAEIAALESGLGELMNEMGSIVTALDGKTHADADA